jgi:hypothetical protein
VDILQTGFFCLPILPSLSYECQHDISVLIKLLPVAGCLEIVPCLVGLLNDLPATNKIQ